MGNNSSIFNFKHVPLSFVVCAVLVVVFECANSYFDNYFYSPVIRHTLEADRAGFEGLRLKIKNEMSQRPGHQYDMIILGDCYNLVGIIPETIEDKTSLRVYNLSTHRIQTILASYLMFDHYLKFNSYKPKYVVMNFLPITLQGAVDVGYLYEFRNGNLKSLTSEFGLSKGFKLWLPSLKHQDFFKHLVTDPFTIRTASGKEIDEFKKSVDDDRGYYAWKSTNVYDGAMGPDEAPYYHFAVSEFAEKYLKKILDLAKDNQIEIIYLMPTHPEDVYKVHFEHGMIPEYEHYIEELLSNYSNSRIVRPQKILYDKNLYVDWIHLNRYGAEKLSDWVSSELLKIAKR